MKKAGLVLLLTVVCSALAIPANLHNSNRMHDDLEDRIELSREGGTTRIASNRTLNMQSLKVEPVVEAYNTPSSVQISVQNYTGPVLVEIYGGRGVIQSTFEVYEVGFDEIILSGLRAGQYDISITVGSDVYTGVINKGGNGR